MARKAENVTLCMGHNTPMLQCIGLKRKVNILVHGVNFMLMEKFLIVRNVAVKFLIII